MAMALLCRSKGFFRYQLCGRLFSSSAASTPSPIVSSFSLSGPVMQHRCVPSAMTVSSFLRATERRFSAEATTSYPTPPPPGNFDDFPEAGDGDYDEDGGEDEDPPPDPEEDALYSPSESEN